MRRAALVLTLAATSLLAFPMGVSATGPGGWNHLGHGATSTLPALNGPVYALNADSPGVLLVGGAFTSAGGNANATRVATWNGTAWGALNGTPIDNGAVNALAYHGGKVYAGGTFINAGGKADADFLAVWDGSSWGPACAATGPAITATVKALAVIDNTLYVGGSFGNAAANPAADFLVACDLTDGKASATVLADGDINSGIEALAADSNGVLYAGGAFINLNGIAAADHVAAYDPGTGTWSAMGSGAGAGGAAVDSMVRSLAAWGTTVYVGTDSTNIAGIPTADHVAAWNGSAWSPVGGNTAGTDGWFTTGTFVDSLAVNGPMIFAGGSFQNANGVATADEIAYFDGTTWRPIGSNGAGNGPIGSQASALAIFRSGVYAGGAFTSAGGDTLARSVAVYALTLPDARIGLVSTGPFAGNNVYSPTGSGESRTRTVARTKGGTFYVSIQNDGLVAASFTIKGTGSARGYTVHYYRGATNVTASVKAGTWSTGAIGPRSSIILRVRVTLASSTAASVRYLVKATSISGTPADAVKVIVKAK